MTSIYKTLHEQLSIPSDYYLADMPEPRLPLDKRRDAIVKLTSSGEIKEDSTDALIDAMCRKLGRFVGARDVRKIPVGHNPWRDEATKKFAKARQIVAALIEDPAVSTFALADRLEVGETTVRRYRAKLRSEGKIP